MRHFSLLVGLREYLKLSDKTTKFVNLIYLFYIITTSYYLRRRTLNFAGLQIPIIIFEFVSVKKMLDDL